MREKLKECSLIIIFVGQTFVCKWSKIVNFIEHEHFLIYFFYKLSGLCFYVATYLDGEYSDGILFG